MRNLLFNPTFPMSFPATTPSTIMLCATDHQQLRLRLSLALNGRAPRAGGVLADLRGELNRAIVVPDSELPAHVVRIGSEVQVQDLETRETETYTVVLPEQADPDRGRLSVLAPLGLAVLGYAVGDRFSWQMPRGPRQLQILAVRNRA